MQTQSISLAPDPVGTGTDPTPYVLTPQLPLETARPVLDPMGALVAMGELTDAIDRRVLTDVLAAWRRYCESVNRADLLRAAPRLAPVPIFLEGPDGWAYLQDHALMTARAFYAYDAERHWQAAAGVFMQAAANAAVAHGTRLAAHLQAWQLADWQDETEDGDPISMPDGDALATMAARAAHYARIVLGPEEPRRSVTAVERRAAHARCEVERVIRHALLDAEVIQAKCGPAYVSTDDVLDVCTICRDVDGHDRDCPMATLTADNLLRVYRAAMEGGAF